MGRKKVTKTNTTGKSSPKTTQSPSGKSLARTKAQKKPAATKRSAPAAAKSKVRKESAGPRKKESAGTKKSTRTAKPSQEKIVTLSEPSRQQQQLLQSRLISAKFGDIVTVLMQSKYYENLALKALRGFVVPPLLNNQYRLAEIGRKGMGERMPAGLILWARVSDEIDQKLKSSLDKPLMLNGEQWTSGENYWIIDAIGQERFLLPLLTDLRNTDFKGKEVRYRVRTKDGAEVRILDKAEAEKKRSAG